MKTVGYFGFEPGLTDNDDSTSTGNAHWLKKLISELSHNKINFLNGSVGEKSDRNAHAGDALKDADVILISWRWEMPDKLQRHKAWIRQLMVLDFASKMNVPVIIHDSDYIDKEIHETLSKYENLDYTLTIPALYPPKGYKTLFFPNPYHTATYRPLNNRLFECAYIGNNYLRYEQMKETYAELAGSYQIDVWGNWLEDSKSRQSPAQVIEDFKGVKFHKRISQSMIPYILGDALFTHQFAKPEYCEIGFITPRIFESTYSGCLTIFPDEFRMPDEFEHVLKLDNLNEILADETYYKATIKSQIEIADEIDGTQVFVDLIKNL